MGRAEWGPEGGLGCQGSSVPSLRPGDVPVRFSAHRLFDSSTCGRSVGKATARGPSRGEGKSWGKLLLSVRAPGAPLPSLALGEDSTSSQQEEWGTSCRDPETASSLPGRTLCTLYPDHWCHLNHCRKARARDSGCGSSGKTTACDSSMSREHQFKPWLLHFLFSLAPIWGVIQWLKDPYLYLPSLSHILPL